MRILSTLCLLVAACGATDPPFSSVLAVSGPGVTADGALDRIPLAVWGDAEDSVFFVGGGLGVVSGGKAVPGLFAHWDGKTLTELGSVDPTLWWVTGFGANDVWAVGEEGTIVHWNGSALVTVRTGINATLPGIWGTSANNLWVVGGSQPGAINGVNDVILHCLGSCEVPASWKQIAPSKPSGSMYLKVWGAADDDIFLVGRDGVMGHYDGAAWSLGSSPVPSSLVTVHGRSSSDVYAVGGSSLGGVLLHYDGAAWSQVAHPFGSGLTGVFAHPSGDLFVVGLGGQKLVQSNGVWSDYTTTSPPTTDIHSVWIDSGGKNGFAVGGNYNLAPNQVSRRFGTITRIGSSLPAVVLKSP